VIVKLIILMREL